MESLVSRFHKQVFLPYLELLKSEYRIHPKFAHVKEVWESKLVYDELINGPYLERAQVYAKGDPVDSLSLHEGTRASIRAWLKGRSLYKHQTDALRHILKGENTVIATGTSSGKTLCYQIPIVDDLIRDSSNGLRAIIIYPLNALVNDQLSEWDEILKDYPQVTYARFTGQTPDDQAEYESRLKDAFRARLADQQLTEQELQREIARLVKDQIRHDPVNRLNHRDAIRTKPPHILITNFSMLEYLLERPIDAPIFNEAHLRFLVLDEVHAYRGVQATEIAFLIRRLKEHLGLDRLVCIATSATLGKKDDPVSTEKVQRFASELFDGIFENWNPIYGSDSLPELNLPSFAPTPEDYIKAAEILRSDPKADIRKTLDADNQELTLGNLLLHDENLYRLRKEILTKPTLLLNAAECLWPQNHLAYEALQALLEIVGRVKTEGSLEDLLPSRLHYFVKAEDGLYICLHKECSGRHDNNPGIFVSRRNEGAPDGYCPNCHAAGRKSLLIEIMACRKCGYLFGALQDLGPRRAQNFETDENKPYFDSFTTELGWASDSFWSYFSVEDELPYPSQIPDEDDDQIDLISAPVDLDFCVVCGKKNESGAGDNCICKIPHCRRIQIFHRQCPNTGKARDLQNLYKNEKKLLSACPNCNARNSSGIEPLRRFQESDDEIGLAMAIPLSHFQVASGQSNQKNFQRKLLCFTDHRQRAAAFPSLLEEETFLHDFGRKIVRTVSELESISFVSLGELLADYADPRSTLFDPEFFLPSSRLPDEQLDAKRKRDLWISEVFGYFGIPDSAKESAEDLGLVTVEYQLQPEQCSKFRELFGNEEISLSESTAALQVLLSFIRYRKAFTLPKGRVDYDSPSFGRVTADIAYARSRDGQFNIHGWLPRKSNDGTYNHNWITSYLSRVLKITDKDSFDLAEKVSLFLCSEYLLVEMRGRWKLDHERLFVRSCTSRAICDRCSHITSYSAQECCPRKGCVGKLERSSFIPDCETIIAKWVAGLCEPRFWTLKIGRAHSTNK